MPDNGKAFLLSAANTTLDSALPCFVLFFLLYCLRLRALSKLQILVLRGCVRFYVLRQAVFGSNCSGLNTVLPHQTAKATRSSLRPRITIDFVVENPLARMCAYSGFSALLWLAANAARYICLRSKAGPRLLKRRLPCFVPESLARGPAARL